MFKAETEYYWVPEHNFLPEVIGAMNLPEKVMIYDNTLREGEQTPGVVFRKEEKVEIAKSMDELGVGGIEIYASVAGEDFEALQEIKRTGLKNAKLYSLARCKQQDIDKAAEAGVFGVALEGPSNPWIATHVMGLKSYDEVVKNFVDSVKYAKSLGLHTSGGGWDSGRTTLDQLEYQYKALADAGIDELHYGDTFGFTNPWTTCFIYKKMREWIGPDIELATHFHNDFGLAVANSIGAVMGGATVVHTTMNGLGERAGNAPVDEIAVDLELLFGVKTGINMQKLYATGRRIADIAKCPINPNKPITGERLFYTGSGLVLDIRRKLAGTPRAKYGSMPFSPDFVGHPGISIQYGKGVGGSAIAELLETKNKTATREQIASIVAKVKQESTIRKAIVPDYTLDAIIDEVLSQN
jgi:isopropylmalate/homocitrate/citramalate synthase